MTSSEVLSSGKIICAKKMGNESVSRKPSFKCTVPNKSASHRMTRKVVLPISTVQALTFKFNELSQIGDEEKKKLNEAAVKNILGANGKSSTIKVLICRNPSTSRHKRSEEVIVRKRVNLRRFHPNNAVVKETKGLVKETEENSGPNVLKKISAFEEIEKAEIDSSKKLASDVSISRNTKTQVPKILVDIDLEGENRSNNHKNLNGEEDGSEENFVSVRTAISLFERNFKGDLRPEKSRRSLDLKNSPENVDSANDLVGEKRSEIVGSVKPRPIAAIKPILKKPDEKIVRKTNLSPKDSLKKKRSASSTRLPKNSAEEGRSDSDEKIIGPANLNSRVSTDSKRSNESEMKFKNHSSLHKQIRQTGFSVFSTEIILTEELKRSVEVKVQSKSLGNPSNQSLKPNSSFLWSKKEEIYSSEKRSTSRIDLPLPTPPEGFVPDLIEETVEESMYDDVLPKTGQEYGAKVEKSAEKEAYDDVGVYRRKAEEIEGGNKEDPMGKRILEKNIINQLSGERVPYDSWDRTEKHFYSYDDGEGENYQYVSDGKESVRVVSMESESELYQYIQNNKEDSSNIYEDIQSINLNSLISGERVKDIYEDVNCTTDEYSGNKDSEYLNNNCYESVYNGIYDSPGDGTHQGSCVKSDTSDASNNSGKNAAYEKSNSLYGMSSGNGPVSTDHHHLSNMGDESDSTENSGYQATLFGSACSNSEASQSNSDEWVEVSESESEETIYLVHERPRKSKSAGGNSSSFQKEKRRWKKLQRKSNNNNNNNSDEVKLQSSDDHFYESVGQYENAEIIEKAVKSLEADQTNNIIKEEFYNDDQFIDDFDSQSSEDEAYIDVKLPDIPNVNQGYNITKSLKAAGKKLRKNFSLRKSDLSKSLKRFKKSSRPKATKVLLGNSKETEVDSSQKVERPSTHTNLSNSIYSNNSDSSSSSHYVINSSNSISDLNNRRHRKSWTFRSKFKSNSVETPENNSVLDTNRNSTFYLSLNEVQPKRAEKKSDLLDEIQTVLSKRSSNSCESVSEKIDKEATLRHSDSATTSTSKFRPSVPPPPPPSKVESSASEKTKYSDILWGEKAATNNCLYVESGLFDKQKKHSRCTDSDTSLYAEIGLYAASDELNGRKTQMFVDEPLYQFYTECVNQRARDDILNNYDSEGYEEINDYYSVINEKRRTIDIKNVRPNFEDLDEDTRSSKISSFSSISDRRTLWCQIPAVVDSCILQTLTEQARKLQEAKFEIITSEGSYMNSLNVLENHFMKKVNDLNMITKRDFRILFGNIVSVKKCSENFLEDLENCWQNNIMLNGICDIVYKHSTTSFQVYTKYCKNQVCIYRTLRELLDKNWNFENALKEIESDPICQNLNIHSFLMLPMQRITRLPLLMGAVLARMSKTDDEYEVCKASFDVLNKIVQDCDDEARRMERCEEMLILSQQIEFPKDIRRIPIITGSRFLVKSGQVTQLVNRDENKLTFGKKFSKITLTLFLFTDLLIVAKKKNPRNYVVVDHCPRNLVQMQTTEGLTQLPVKFNANSDASGKLLMLLTMLENHEKKTVEMMLMFEMESDKQRWLEAVTPKYSENPNECIYEEWDCPQVIALYEFTPVQPDELNLCIGDVVNVLKKMGDGWYQGERLRDGARGWFPQNHTQEVSSSHIRAKNKKLRYKLLALSGNLIDSQKMNGGK